MRAAICGSIGVMKFACFGVRTGKIATFVPGGMVAS